MRRIRERELVVFEAEERAYPIGSRSSPRFACLFSVLLLIVSSSVPNPAARRGLVAVAADEFDPEEPDDDLGRSPFFNNDDMDDVKGDRYCDDLDVGNSSDRPPCRNHDDAFVVGGGGGGGAGHGDGGGGGNHGTDGNFGGDRPPPPPPPSQEGSVSGGAPNGAPSGSSTGVARSNQVIVTVYVSLSQGKKSYAHFVGRVLTQYWNDTQSSDFVMHLPPPRNGQRRSLAQRTRTSALDDQRGARQLQEDEDEDGDEEDEDEDGDVEDESPSTGSGTGTSVQSNTSSTPGNVTGNMTWWDMYLLATNPDQILDPTDTAEDGGVWWWSYSIRYACFWGNSFKPVKNATVLNEVTDLLTSSIATGEESGDFYDWLALHYPEVADKAFNLTTVNPADTYLNATDDEFSKPLDPSAWDWRRYTGLGVFCATVLVTAIVMQLAAYRHRRLYKRECWSNVNLGNEKGVDEILQMGWKLKGGHMEIYDKTNLGYSDDNSLFLGGYEQREPGALCEITVTHPTEEASDTNTRVEL
jgi:hypothetical protein